ncbi:MAG: hypothetical protein ACYS9Y_10005 [Planctomycetota bacterium]|jgi:hypothetical protein
MPLHVQTIAVKSAVMSFFSLSIIGWFSGLSPFTCCTRALTGTFIAYIAVGLFVKAINAILISAMITKQMNQQREKENDAGN